MGRTSERFEVTIDVHQGRVLSPAFEIRCVQVVEVAFGEIISVERCLMQII